MADFSAGNYSDLIDNLNPQIASATPKVDFSGIERLTKSYWEGLDQKAKNDLRNVFKGGVPTNPDGSPDYGTMAKSLYQLGNVGEGNNLANIDIQRQQLKLGQDISAGLGGMENPGGKPPLNVPQVAPGATPIPPSSSNQIPRGIRNNNPGNLTATPWTQSQPGYTGADGRFAQFNSPDAGTAAAGNLVQNYGQQGVATPLAIASKWAPRGDGANNPQAYGSFIAKALGVNPDTPLNLSDPNVRQKVVQAISQFENGPNSAPPGGPAPVPPQAQPQPMQAPQQQPVAPQGAYPPAAPNRSSFPTGIDPEIQTQIARLTQIVSNPALPQPVRDAAKSSLEFIQKQAEPTNEQKNYDIARRQGYQGSFDQYQTDQKMAQSRAGKQGEQFAVQYQNIQEGGQKAATSVPQLQIAKQLTTDPNFYSGLAADKVIFLKQLIGVLGGDKNSAAPMQEAHGLVNQSILGGLKAIVQGTGQIRSTELKLMQSAAAAPFDTPDSYRFKLEVATRAQERAAELADLARSYNGGNLDAGFDRAAAKLFKDKPLFSDAELKNPKLLGYPQFSSPQQVMSAKLPRGSKFRVQGTDEVRTVP